MAPPAIPHPDSAACPGSDDAPTHIGSTKEVWDEEKKYRSQTGFFENFFCLSLEVWERSGFCRSQSVDSVF